MLPVAVTAQQAANIHRNNPNNVRVQLTNADGDVLNAWVHSMEPDLVIDATARQAAAAARAVADAATTPAEATTIANTRAAARFTDAEKSKLNGIAAQATRNVDLFLTQARYDALAAKDANTTYFITG